jgi:CheY-like chemotaxis protein
VLLVAPSGEARATLASALARHEERASGRVGALVATSFSLGLCLAERHRPDLVLLDLGLAATQAFDACHVLAGLASRSGRRCRVVAGTAAVTSDIERAALMAGAASLALFPFTSAVVQSELERLGERLAPRKGAKEVRRHA